MKKKFFIPVILIGMMIVGFASFYQIGDPNADTAPAPLTFAASPDTITVPPFPFPTLFNFNYASVPGMNAGTVGAMFFNGKYYFNRWNSSMMYRYNNNGPGGAPGTLADSFTYVGSCRDLTSDGTYLYGGPATTTLYRINPNTGANMKTITLAGGGISRAIAWDPNRKGFWSCNFSGNIFLNDTNGALVKQIAAGNTISGKYGMGFDSSSVQDSAFLWVWSQDFSVPTDTTNKIHKININTGAIVGIYTVNINGVGIAGGAEVIANAIPGKLVLLCNYQNYALVGYNLKNLSSPPTPPVWSFADSSATGVSVNCISTVNKDVAWIGCNGGLIKKTTNGGTTFTAINNATVGANDIYAICGISANVAFVSTSPSATYVFRTSDGGTTWTQVFTQAGGFIDDIRFKDANTGFMYGDPVASRWSLWKTTNAGVSWDSAGLYLPQVASEAGWNNAMCIDGNNIWFGTNNTKVYKSNNFGATGSWTSGATTGSTNSYSVAFNGNIGFSGTSAAVKSTDGGATYSAFTLAGSGNIYAFNTIKNTGRFWVARFNTIYGSTDNGLTFAPQYVRSSTIQTMHLVLDGNIVRGFAGTSTGAIYKFDEGGVTSVTPVTTEIPQNFSLSQNYPNPFNPTTKINFALPKSGLVSLKVYDMLGKEVATLVNEVKSAGTYAVDFNGASLSSGMYFYKISVNGFSDVKKMLMIK